jgi:hypothetical protein
MAVLVLPHVTFDTFPGRWDAGLDGRGSNDRGRSGESGLAPQELSLNVGPEFGAQIGE